ncbi:MAG TPA: CehA/McbA family metallohydrolase [Clostridia bacterium]|nr:CehA/McbA family metallohydrolase [Clostridia bacterium]
MKLKIRAFDQNKKAIPCKITIQKLSFDDSQYAEGSVNTVYCSGTYECSLENGLYDINVYRGKLFKPYRERIHMGGGDIYIDAVLHELLDIEAMGLYAFDGHSHVSRDRELVSGNLQKAALVMKGEGFHFFFAGSPYDNETHLECLKDSYTEGKSYRKHFASTLDRLNDDEFFIDIGNEIIKCRYGHIFLMNYTQYSPFNKYYDHEFDPWLFNKEGEEPPYRIPYMYEALALEKEGHSVAVFAHPTSWWWHDNGEFITNIATTLGFEILAESIDAMVVMGYKSDQIHYQQLWFDALNNGYFLPGIAETDTLLDTVPSKFTSFKTYTYFDGKFGNIDALCDAIKKGRNIVSTGPLVTLKVEGELPGSVLSYSDDDRFHIDVEAFACFEGFLSKVQLIINGEVYKEYNIRQNRFRAEECMGFQGDSFIIAKCYDYAGNVSFTNPVYIRNSPFVNRGYLSHVKVTVLKDNGPASGVYSIEGGSEHPFENEIDIKMGVSSGLRITVGDEIRTIRLFELEELQDIFKNLYFGRFNAHNRYLPGEVPADCFRLRRIRQILDEVELTLKF